MADSPEESSWTFYIDGFICDSNKSCFSSEIESPSLLSDAASCQVTNKLLCSNCNCNWTQGFSSAKNIQNSFKKQKTKIIPAVDCELEDTASSPVNSPKVSYMNVFNRDEKKEKAKMDVSEVRRNSFGKVFAAERDNNYAELKKRSSSSGQED